MQNVTQVNLLERVLKTEGEFSVVTDHFDTLLHGELSLLHSYDGINDWILRFTYRGQERVISIGVFPKLSLEQARGKAKAALKLARQDIDPTYENQRRKWDGEMKLADYLRYFKKDSFNCDDAANCLLRNLYNLLGALPLSALTGEDFKTCIDLTQNQKKKNLLLISLIIFFNYLLENKGKNVFQIDEAKIKELGESLGLEEALGKKTSKTSLSIYIKEWFGQILLKLDEKRKDSSYRSKSINYALSLLPYLPVNPQTLLQMRWEEIDWKEHIWRAKFDNEKNFIMPLSNQAVELLSSLKAVRFCNIGYVFRSGNTDREEKPIPKTSLGKALCGMGFSPKEISATGFRAYAEKYFLNPCRYSSDVVKLQLGKKVPNEAIYKIGPEAFLEERRKMIQDLADHLDELKKNATKEDIS